MNKILMYLPNSYHHGANEMKRQVLHDTGNIKGDTAYANYNYFNSNVKALSRGVTAHYFIDDKEILETVPYNKKCWHVGGISNIDTVGYEMCNMITQNNFDKMIENTIQILLLDRVTYMNSIPVTKSNLTSHGELNKIENTGSTHNDPERYLNKFGWSMDKIRNEVSNRLEQVTNNSKQRQYKDKIIINELDYHTVAINKAIDNNIIFGINNIIDANKNISLGDLLSILDRLNLLNKGD